MAMMMLSVLAPPVLANNNHPILPPVNNDTQPDIKKPWDNVSTPNNNGTNDTVTAPHYVKIRDTSGFFTKYLLTAWDKQDKQEVVQYTEQTKSGHIFMLPSNLTNVRLHIEWSKYAGYYQPGWSINIDDPAEFDYWQPNGERRMIMIGGTTFSPTCKLVKLELVKNTDKTQSKTMPFIYKQTVIKQFPIIEA
ncbi:MAG: hypothetical protein LBU24_00700 [Methanocalculaceae archaeon]|jgi:hypothetical protein|nr:hypothetical protein [Methanocalculaceae archaeon]